MAKDKPLSVIHGGGQLDVAKLRELHLEATRELNRLELVKVEAERTVAAQHARSVAAIGVYDAAIMQARIDANCPQGWSIDVHGDGAVKPLTECLLPGGRTPPAPAPAAPPRRG